jgi:hypothetical protein
MMLLPLLFLGVAFLSMHRGSERVAQVGEEVCVGRDAPLSFLSLLFPCVFLVPFLFPLVSRVVSCWSWIPFRYCSATVPLDSDSEHG